MRPCAPQHVLASSGLPNGGSLAQCPTLPRNDASSPAIIHLHPTTATLFSLLAVPLLLFRQVWCDEPAGAKPHQRISWLTVLIVAYVAWMLLPQMRMLLRQGMY